MILLGVLLLVLAQLIPVPLLFDVGVILIIAGIVLWILGSTGRPIAGRRYWF